MAERLAAAGHQAGAEVRLRQVGELAPPEAITSNAAWSQHFDRTKDGPKATAHDVVWADAVLFGSPTRDGKPGYIDPLNSPTVTRRGSRM
jgi:NAD(P)H dehydrogenase (quinone)